MNMMLTLITVLILKLMLLLNLQYSFLIVMEIYIFITNRCLIAHLGLSVDLAELQLCLIKGFILNMTLLIELLICFQIIIAQI